MIVTTTNTLGDQDITETIGMVRGSTTWRRRMVKTYRGGIRSVQQTGQLDFDAALEEIKQEALDSMIKSASANGASAIVGMTEQITEVTTDVFMVTVMGTAVRCQPKQKVVHTPVVSGANDNAADFSHLFDQQIAAGGSAYCH